MTEIPAFSPIVFQEYKSDWTHVWEAVIRRIGTRQLEIQQYLDKGRESLNVLQLQYSNYFFAIAVS